MNSERNFEIIKAGYSKKKGRPYISMPSRKVEIFYTRQLLDISKQCKAEGQQILQLMIDSERFVGDSFVGDAPSFLGRIAGIVKNGISAKVAAISGALASKVAKDQKELVDDRLAKHIKIMSGVDTREIIRYGNASKVIEDAIAVNTSYIEDIPKQYHSKLEKILMTAVQQGKGTVWVGDEIEKLGKATDNRAKLIAQDQVLSISKQFNKDSQENLGIDKYVWISREDRRVRGSPDCIYPQYRGNNARYSHYKRHDKIFKWVQTGGESDPGLVGGSYDKDGNNYPGDGHPGEPIRCRCEAFPYLE